MAQLTGKIEYKLFAEGTKSECQRPYIFLENGSQILVYLKDDNPFENKGFELFSGKEVVLEGEFIDGTFDVDSVHEAQMNSELESETEKELEIDSENLAESDSEPEEEADGVL